MSVTQVLTYTPAEGQDLVPLNNWILSNLTEEELHEWHSATKNRNSRIRMQEALGHLQTRYVNDQSIWIWDSQESADKGILLDENFVKYHDRYLADTNTTFQIVTTA